MELGLKQPDGDSRALLHRLSQLSEASLRINEPLEDVRVERTGFEYSALVNQILDGRLTIRVPEGVANSTHDDQESTAATLRINVEPPPAQAPSGSEIWSAEMTVGDYSVGAPTVTSTRT